jgi:hypothetical protein
MTNSSFPFPKHRAQRSFDPTRSRSNHASTSQNATLDCLVVWYVDLIFMTLHRCRLYLSLERVSRKTHHPSKKANQTFLQHPSSDSGMRRYSSQSLDQTSPISQEDYAITDRYLDHQPKAEKKEVKGVSAAISASSLKKETLYWVLLPAPPAALLESEPAGRTVSPPWRMLSRISLSPPRTSRSIAASSSGPPTPLKSEALVCLPVTGLMSPPSERGISRLSLAPWPPIFTSAPGNFFSTDWSTPDSMAEGGMLAPEELWI